MQTQHIARGMAYALGAAILWGLSGNAGQYLFTAYGATAAWLVTLRLIISGVIFLLITLFTHPQELLAIWRDHAHVHHLILFSFFGMMANQFTYFMAIEHSNAAVATILQYMGPIIIAAYIALRTKIRPPRQEILAIALSLLGIFLLVTHGDPRSLTISNTALFWGVCSAFTLAIYTIYPQRLMKRYNASTIVGWSMFCGGIFLGLLTRPTAPVATWDNFAYVAFAYLIIFGTLIPYYAYLLSIKYIGPTKASICATGEPLSAAAFSVLLMGITFGPMDWLGSLLIITAVIMLALRK